AEAGAVHDVAQPERLAGMLERPQDLGRVKERLHEIQLAPAPPAFRRGVHAFYIAQPATCGRRSAEPGDAPTNPWNRSPLTEVAGVLLSFASRTETCRSNGRGRGLPRGGRSSILKPGMSSETKPEVRAERLSDLW